MNSHLANRDYKLLIVGIVVMVIALANWRNRR